MLSIYTSHTEDLVHYFVVVNRMGTEGLSGVQRLAARLPEVRHQDGGTGLGGVGNYLDGGSCRDPLWSRRGAGVLAPASVDLADRTGTDSGTWPSLSIPATK